MDALEEVVEAPHCVEDGTGPCVVFDLDLPERGVVHIFELAPHIAGLVRHFVESDDDWRRLWKALWTARRAWPRLDAQLTRFRDFRRRLLTGGCDLLGGTFLPGGGRGQTEARTRCRHGDRSGDFPRAVSAKSFRRTVGRSCLSPMSMYV